MLFQRDKDQNEGEKKPSTLGFLFNPGIGRSIHPIGESIGMFVRLIALIFASNGLFPKDHPALNNTNIRLTMADVISTAWSGLSFTKQGIPRVVLFFAVVGCLVFSALLVLTLIATLAMGSAHAADTSTSSMFDTPDITNDIAHGWIGYLFKGETIANLTVQNNGQWYQVPQSQKIQEALKTALAFYSNGILVFAGVILLYHLMMMIVETAHQGVPFGKSANQIWAPLRLVVAIGLLVPISGGLNTGQYIMIQMADWGSGLASQTWKTFLDAFANQTSSYVSPPTPSVLSAVRGMAKVYACTYAYDKYVALSHGSSSESIPDGELIGSGQARNVDYADSVDFGTRDGEHWGVCGRYTLPKLGAGGAGSSALDPQYSVVKQIYANSSSTFNVMKSKIQTVAQKYADYYMTTHDFSSSSDTIPPNNELMDIVKDYRTELQSSNSSLKNDNNSSLKILASDWSRLGWAAAGAWLNTIARSQDKVLNAPVDSVPSVMPPLLLGNPVPCESPTACSPAGRTSELIARFSGWADQGYAAGAAFTSSDFEKMGIDAGYKSPVLNGKGDDGFAQFISAMLIAASNTVKQADGGSPNQADSSKDTIPWISIGSTVDPFKELIDLGHRQLTTAFFLLDNTVGLGAEATAANSFVTNMAGQLEQKGGKKGAWFGAALRSAGTDMVGPAVSVVLGVIALVAAMLFTVGVTLSFIIPLLPFTVFFFNTVSWGVSLFEAVVSMPLLALAHLSTKGEGLPGDMARQGYFFIFSIFLRPVLMVFGLVAGILIFYVALALLNLTFSIAMRGSGSYVDTGAYSTISQVIFNIIYAMFVYICANTAFKTINFFPEHAMNWMSSRGPSTERMGDKALMNQTAQMITAYGFRETVGSMYSRAPVLTAGLTQTGSAGRGVATSLLKGELKDDGMTSAQRKEQAVNETERNFRQDMGLNPDIDYTKMPNSQGSSPPKVDGPKVEEPKKEEVGSQTAPQSSHGAPDAAGAANQGIMPDLMGGKTPGSGGGTPSGGTEQAGGGVWNPSRFGSSGSGSTSGGNAWNPGGSNIGPSPFSGGEKPSKMTPPSGPEKGGSK